jgi:hypothetical protein
VFGVLCGSIFWGPSIWSDRRSCRLVLIRQSCWQATKMEPQSTQNTQMDACQETLEGYQPAAVALAIAGISTVIAGRICLPLRFGRLRPEGTVEPYRIRFRRYWDSQRSTSMPSLRARRALRFYFQGTIYLARPPFVPAGADSAAAKMAACQDTLGGYQPGADGSLV